MTPEEYAYWVLLGRCAPFGEVAEEWLASGCDPCALDALEAGGLDGHGLRCLDALARGASLRTVCEKHCTGGATK